MKFIKTSFSGACLIEPKKHEDERGWLCESYSEKDFEKVGINKLKFVQENHVMSKEAGTIRGMHFQCPPHAQEKLIRVIRGSILNVIVDLRVKSDFYGLWEGFLLSKKSMKMLLVPRGFANGYCTLENNTEVLYKVSSPYNPEAERGIRWNDNCILSREERLKLKTETFVISERDQKWPLLNQDFKSPFSADNPWW